MTHLLKATRLALLTLVTATWLTPAAGLPPLQLYVEITPPGGVLIPPPGEYAGPVVINRPITIKGQNKVTINGEGNGTILTIRADGTTLSGLRFTNSGESHNSADAAILIEANDALIENNSIDNTLFGIHLKQAIGNTLRGNHISSKQRDISLRGDSIRLWNSHENLIENNSILDSRDMVFSSSTDNRIIGNTIRKSRIGMEFVFSERNEIIDNSISESISGITIIYSNELTIRGNRLWRMRNITGSGISLKESFNVVIEKNEIAHCARGLLANSPLEPENILRVYNNLFTYNDIANYFYGEKGGHILRGNQYVNNFVDVMGSAPTTVRDNDWRGNYWDKYQGLDLDSNGNGDLPHQIYLYSDRIWMERSMARFFRGSPALSLIDFIERLTPYSNPDLVLTDPQPLMH